MKQKYMLVVNRNGSLRSTLCSTREEADQLAKSVAGDACGEVEIYQLVGVWKPSSPPVEFIPVDLDAAPLSSKQGRQLAAPVSKVIQPNEF
jgi:hypothetical protein